MKAPVTIAIDWKSAEPVYGQIADQVRERIAAGQLRPGDPLPPVRTLASDLGVNLNTVARAYRLLEEEGFVKIADRAGTLVAAPAPSADTESRERLREDLREVLARMRQAGVGPEEMRRLAEREIASLSGRDAKVRQGERGGGA
jgi:DNA-binding transcriptional regulator YhcF (GntR family)